MCLPPLPTLGSSMLQQQHCVGGPPQGTEVGLSKGESRPLSPTPEESRFLLPPRRSPGSSLPPPRLENLSKLRSWKALLHSVGSDCPFKFRGSGEAKW